MSKIQTLMTMKVEYHRSARMPSENANFGACSESHDDQAMIAVLVCPIHVRTHAFTLESGGEDSPTRMFTLYPVYAGLESFLVISN